jgi:hypothetical protein
MSPTNVEIARRTIEENRSQPLDDVLVTELFHPEIEFSSRLSSIEGASYRGYDGIRRYHADMSDAWREWRMEPEAMEDLGSDRVHAQVRMRAVAQGGVPVDLRSWMIIEIADQKVRRMDVYGSREEALAAAGVSD